VVTIIILDSTVDIQWAGEKMFRNPKGFTLIELIVIIVIIGILAAVAIPKYLDLVQEASDGTARGVLGSLRSANALRFGKNILGNTPAAYTMGDIANDIAELKGFTWAAAATTFQMTVGGYIYTFTITPTPEAPTTYGIISAATATW
jgi:prepilin-type N-terminal cleavage/methylation domain-containing protein